MNKLLRKLHLWLIAHGLEFEHGAVHATYPHNPLHGSVSRHVAIVVNHRYLSINLTFNVHRGVFTDELDTPHSEIAAGRAAWDAEREVAL